MRISIRLMEKFFLVSVYCGHEIKFSGITTNKVLCPFLDFYTESLPTHRIGPTLIAVSEDLVNHVKLLIFST